MLSSLTFCVAALAHAAAASCANALVISSNLNRALRDIPDAAQYVDRLLVSVVNSGEVSNTTGMFAYFATKLYCDTNYTKSSFKAKEAILKTIASVDPQALLESRISDKVSAFQELLKCQNNIQHIFSFKPSMLEKADPNALVRLPELTLRMFSEHGYFDLKPLANIKLTDSQRKQFVGPLLQQSVTPFITPALLVKLIVSNHTAMNAFVTAAAQDTIDIAAHALRHTTLESLKNFSAVVPTMDRNSFFIFIQSFKNNRSLYRSIFEVYGQHLANSYGECSASLFAFFNFLGCDGIMTVYDRAMLHILSNPVQDKLLVFKLFNHQLSLSMETTIRQSKSTEHVSMRDLIYSKIYDPSNVGTRELPFNGIFSKADMETFNVKYIIGFTTFLQFASVYNVDDGKPLAFVSEADCVGRHTAYEEQHDDLDRHAFPCHCITNQSANAGIVLNMYTLLGQTHCLQKLFTLDSSAKHDASLNVDSALLSFINDMPSNFNDINKSGHDQIRSINWAQRVHEDLSNTVTYLRQYPSLEQKLKSQLECFQFSKIDRDNYAVKILCRNIAPLARSMVDPSQRQVYGIERYEDLFATVMSNQSKRLEAMSDNFFANNNDPGAIPDPSLWSQNPRAVIVCSVGVFIAIMLIALCVRRTLSKRQTQLRTSRPSAESQRNQSASKVDIVLAQP